MVPSNRVAKRINCAAVLRRKTIDSGVLHRSTEQTGQDGNAVQQHVGHMPIRTIPQESKHCLHHLQ